MSKEKLYITMYPNTIIRCVILANVLLYSQEHVKLKNFGLFTDLIVSGIKVLVSDVFLTLPSYVLTSFGNFYLYKQIMNIISS